VTTETNFTESGSSPPQRLQAPRQPPMFPIYFANTAAHLAILGHQLTLSPSPATRSGVSRARRQDAGRDDVHPEGGA